MTVEVFQPEKLDGDSSDVFVLHLHRAFDQVTVDRLREDWLNCWRRTGKAAPVLAILGPDVSLERVIVRRQMTGEDLGLTISQALWLSGDAEAEFRRLLQPDAGPPGKLCEGCPPVGYITNKTRCSECPRR